MDQRITTAVPILAGDGETNRIAWTPLAVEAKRLLKALKATKSTSVRFFTAPHDQVVFRPDSLVDISLKYLPPEDFPTALSLGNSATMTVDCGELRRILERTAPFMSVEETRYYLNGVYLHRHGLNLRAVATDGHRLGLAETDLVSGMPDKAAKIILASAVKILIRLLKKQKVGNVSVEWAKDFGGIVATVAGSTYQTKEIDGTYPDYQRVLPDKTKMQRVSFSVADMLPILDQAVAIATDRVPPVKFTTNGGKTVEVSARAAGGSKVEQTIPCDGAFDIPGEGKTLRYRAIGFNAKFVARILKKMTVPQAELFANDATAPCYLNGVGESETVVLMPYRV